MRRYRRRHKRIKYKLILTLLILLIFCLTIGYSAFSTNINLTVKGNIKDKSRVIQSWNKNSNEDFHTDFYKENIISVTFLDSAVVPSNVVEKWDVSETKAKGVMAYITESTTETGKYDLYIGAKSGVIANSDSSFLFYNFRGLKSIKFNGLFNTENVINLDSIFKYCTSISEIDLSDFDTRNVTNMGNMFCMFDNSNGQNIENKLTKITFGPNFVTKNVVSMAQMFVACTHITELDISNWDTSNVQNMDSVFANCYSLSKIDVSKWNTSSVTTMQWLFMGTSIQTLNLTNWNTSNVTSMYCMFSSCSKLTELNLCSFDTSKVTNMNAMFRKTAELKDIYVGPNWTTENASTEEMFLNSSVQSTTTGKCNN